MAYFLTRHLRYDPSKHTLQEATKIAGGSRAKANRLLALWPTRTLLQTDAIERWIYTER